MEELEFPSEAHGTCKKEKEKTAGDKKGKWEKNEGIKTEQEKAL